MSERTAKGPSTTRELSRAQQTAGRRAAESRATIPDVSWVTEARVGAGPFEPALLAAVAAALRAVPALNATYRDGTVVEHGRVNVAVAMETGDAAAAPVIADADTREDDLGAELDRLRAGVEANTLTAAAFAGATFTVVGLGLEDGVRRVVPPVTPGQVAVLGVGAPGPRVIAEDGVPAVADVVELVLVADARAVRGTDATRWLATVADRLAAFQV